MSILKNGLKINQSDAPPLKTLILPEVLLIKALQPSEHFFKSSNNRLLYKRMCHIHTCSDRMTVLSIPALLGNYKRPPTNRPAVRLSFCLSTLASEVRTKIMRTSSAMFAKNFFRWKP